MTKSTASKSIPTVRHIDGHTLSHLHSHSTSTTSLVPILTPPIGGSSEDDRQYILVPNSRRIVVRSAHHGKKICDLIIVPTKSKGGNGGGDDDERESHVDGRCDDYEIRAVTLAWLPSAPPSTVVVEDDEDGDFATTNNGEWVILAGCKNGMVHEWSVADLSSSSLSASFDYGTMKHYGRVSRRSFQLVSSSSSGKKKSVLELMHMTSPSSSTTDEYEVPPSFVSGGKALLYGLVTKTTTTTTTADDTATSTNNDNVISLTTTKGENSDKVASSSPSSTWLVRMEIPPFTSSSSSTTTSTQHPHHRILPIKALVPVKVVSSKAYLEGTRHDKFVCLKKNDSIFGFLASYRQRHAVSRQQHDRSMLKYQVDDNNEHGDDGNSRYDVFLVMCSSHGLAMYRDSLTTSTTNHQYRSLLESSSSCSSSPTTNLVHFTKIMKSSNKNIPKEEMIVTSLAVSPDTKDLALGRGGGQIEILDNVFENVATYIDRRKQYLDDKKKITMGAAVSSEVVVVGESDLLQRLWQYHPEEVTIRRHVHWHAHPVRTLAFMSVSSGGGGVRNTNAIANPMSLLSGGEESVLVTWQLDRNFHRPSHFVSRVGRGGIVHMLTCRGSGKVIVFCSDNSIQCYDGSTYERDWAEFGLAAMALHVEEDEEEDDCRRRCKRSPIIMVKDPITNFPMLTNLPGAPGMVHWYDPTSASVVGTLEVSRLVGYAIFQAPYYVVLITISFVAQMNILSF